MQPKLVALMLLAAAAAAVEMPPLVGQGAAPASKDPFAPLVSGQEPLIAPLPGMETPAAAPPEASAAPAAEEAALLQQAEGALGGGAAGSNGGASAAFEPAGALAAPQRSNFSSLISLLDPPPSFAMPPLSAAQQAAVPRLRAQRQGVGTVNVGSFDAAGWACGMGYLSDLFRAFFVALPEQLFRSSEACGACVRIWCVDSVCLDPLVGNATFMVVDSCRECRGADLLVAAPGFANLTGVDVNISPQLQVAWAPEPCAPRIEGGIRMLASPSNNPTYLSLNFSNLKQLLRAVSINGIDIPRTRYGTWELNGPAAAQLRAPPFDLVLVSAQGQRLTKRLTSLRSQDLGINFD